MSHKKAQGTKHIKHKYGKQTNFIPFRYKTTTMENNRQLTDLSEERQAPTVPVESHVTEAAKHAYYKQLVAKVLTRYYEGSKGENENRSVSAHQQKEEESKFPPARPVRGCQHGHCGPTNHESSTTTCPASSDTNSRSSAKRRSNTKDIIESITAHDVLFGRRSAQRNNPGNMRLRELCSALYQEYKEGNRPQKTSLTWRIVHKIQYEGGRFLKWDDSQACREVNNDMAREKVAFTIRDLNLSNGDSE